ncbi:hypothetical protein ACHWQZ_G001335 [Mnemiopsis leidyi]
MGGWSILPRKSDRVNGKLLRSCIAESFGTFSVVFWGTGAAIESNVALGFGIATAVTAYIFHDISGAHFNPAVSLAMFVAQRISLVRCLLYWAMQLLGAVLGAGSFTIIFTYLAATNTERRQRVSSYDFPLAVGLAVYVVHLTLHPLTGAGVNPARALMVNAVNKEVRHSIWVYIVGPLIASLVGALSYELIFSYPLKEWLDEKIEMDAAGRRQHSPPKELQIIDSNTQDVVVENPVTKVNGDFAYE